MKIELKWQTKLGLHQASSIPSPFQPSTPLTIGLSVWNHVSDKLMDTNKYWSRAEWLTEEHKLPQDQWGHVVNSFLTDREAGIYSMLPKDKLHDSPNLIGEILCIFFTPAAYHYSMP